MELHNQGGGVTGWVSQPGRMALFAGTAEIDLLILLTRRYTIRVHATESLGIIFQPGQIQIAFPFLPFTQALPDFDPWNARFCWINQFCAISGPCPWLLFEIASNGV